MLYLSGSEKENVPPQLFIWQVPGVNVCVSVPTNLLPSTISAVTNSLEYALQLFGPSSLWPAMEVTVPLSEIK